MSVLKEVFAQGMDGCLMVVPGAFQWLCGILVVLT